MIKQFMDILYQGVNGKYHKHAVSELILVTIAMILMILLIQLSYYINNIILKRIFAVIIITLFLFGINIFILYLFENHFVLNVLLLVTNNLVTALSYVIPNDPLNSIWYAVIIGLIAYIGMMMSIFINRRILNEILIYSVLLIIICACCHYVLCVIAIIIICFIGEGILFFILWALTYILFRCIK